LSAPRSGQLSTLLSDASLLVVVGAADGTPAALFDPSSRPSPHHTVTNVPAEYS